MTKDEQVFTPAEVAKLLRVTQQTVYNLLQSGTLRDYKIGAHLRIPASAIDEHLNRPPKSIDNDA